MHAESLNTILGKLNEHQRNAVEAIEGPVMVVAGPGTGKTQILSARIANILNRTDTAPRQILCLTFTDAGAVAMRQRLLEFIGPDAYNVNIFTFHALCNQIIQENLDVFRIRGLQAASELEIYDCITSIIDALPVDHILKRLRGEHHYDADNLKRLFQLMKQENLSSVIVKQLAENAITDLPFRDENIYKRSGKGYKAGELKTTKIQAETDKLHKLIAASALFDTFNENMKNMKRYDFNDMLLWVIKEFKENHDILLNYQEKYQYILVDEYQDTNGAQSDLLDLLANYWEEPNLFVVGDDDQSIYRFQGANLGNILRFSNKYKNGLRTEVLTDNYRSSQKILDAAKSLIENNTERIDGIDKILLAKNSEFALTEHVPVVVEYYNNLHETQSVAEKIMALQHSGVKLKEIAVIYREHRQAEDLLKYLRHSNVAVNIRKKADILSDPLIDKLLCIMEYLHMELKKPHSGEHLLFKIMHFDFYGISPLEVAAISLETNKQKKSWREYLHKNKVIQIGLFETENTSQKEITRLVDDFDYWIKEAANLTMPQLLEKIIAKGGFLSYLMQSKDKMWNMQVIRSFFNFVKEETEKKPGISLEDLLATVEKMKSAGITLPVNEVLFDPDGVHFLTAHSSKGLEFEYVFIIGSNKKFWEKSDGKSPFNIDLIFNQTNEYSAVEESRRLFYVAMTRAKKQLHISWINLNENGSKAEEKARFVAELIEKETVVFEKPTPDNNKLTETEFLLLQELQTPEINLVDKKYLDDLLKNYSLSVTHLNQYLKCPISFYFNNLLHVPSAKSEPLSFGTAIHYALERLFGRMLNHPDKKFPSSDELVREFEIGLSMEKDSFTKSGFERHLAAGRLSLPKYYNARIDDWEKNKVISIERNLRNVVVNGVPLRGKLDKLVFEGNQVSVIDYKTGQYEKVIANKKLSPPDPSANEDDTYEKRVGGDYWRQIVFYHILVDNDKSQNWTMNKGVFDFVEATKDDKFITEEITVLPEHIEVVKKQITQTWNNIMDHKFSIGCGDPKCEWCSFVKYYDAGKRFVAENLPGSSAVDSD